MRVSCQTLDEFLDNLKAREAAQVFDRTLYVSRFIANKNSSRRQVILHASTVIAVDSEKEFILDLDVDCGYDYHEGGGVEALGTTQANLIIQALTEYATSTNLKILPGVLDY